MVVTAQHLATNVGLQILKQGGNAIDAAVAVGYALAVVHPCCGNIGGGGLMLIHRANGKNIFINFREKAPAKLQRDMLIHNNKVDNKKILFGYLGSGVPGTVKGLNLALKKYGTMPLKIVMQPAIRLAQHGYKLTAGDVKFLGKFTDVFRQHMNVAKIFLKSGKPYKVGQILLQSELAHTLSLIAQHGSRAFYRGNIAKQMIKAIQAHGGVMTMKDLADYRAKITKPVVCHYRGYKVMSSPPPGSGTTLCEMLSILNAYPLSKMGFHSAESIHYNIEAMRYAFADRNHYLGDPAFVDNPAKKLLSPQYIKIIRQQIKANKAGNSRALLKKHLLQESPNTTHYSIVDQYGNAVAVTYTLNSFFGNKRIPGNTGFFMNDELDDFTIIPGKSNQFHLIQGKANLLAPGKQPLSSMSPTIIMKNNKLFMVVGTPGGSTIITQILEVIENVIDFHMNIAEAVAAPRYHMQWLPDKVYIEPHAFSKEVIKQLEKMGYKIHVGLASGEKRWGAVMAIKRNLKTGEYSGAADPRRPAGAARGY